MDTERQYIPAITIKAGLIVLVEPNGNVGVYRQRGIGSIPEEYKRRLERKNLLDPRWKEVKELPRSWSIYFENEEIMGKERATYPYTKEKIDKMRKASSK